MNVIVEPVINRTIVVPGGSPAPAVKTVIYPMPHQNSATPTITRLDDYTVSVVANGITDVITFDNYPGSTLYINAVTNLNGAIQMYLKSD